MTVWFIIGETAAIVLMAFFAWFAWSSFREKETRAFSRSAVFFFALIGLNILLLVFPPAVKTALFAGLAGISAVFFLVLFFAPAPRSEIQRVGKADKIDERDVIFARFDLPEGTEEFRDYYDTHPEYASIDREIRALPDLFAPFHNQKEPCLFALAAAEFDFLEHQLPKVEGDARERTSDFSKAENSRLIKKALAYLGSNLCGIAPLDQAYVYSHTGRGPGVYGREIELDHGFAIVFAVEMDWAMTAAAPGAPVIAETGKKYVEAARISIIAADIIRRMGYPARAHIAGSSYQSSSDTRVLFGFHEDTEIHELEVHWQSGKVQRLVAPPIESYLTLREPARE